MVLEWNSLSLRFGIKFVQRLPLDGGFAPQTGMEETERVVGSKHDLAVHVRNKSRELVDQDGAVDGQGESV